jgi:hypothetical protein
MSVSGGSPSARLLGCSWALIAGTAGCSSATILEVVDRSRDGNSEVWVCEGGDAERCRGERDGDVDPEGFQTRVRVWEPPKAPEGCANGAANIQIVLDGDRIDRVRYECAQPPTVTGLPTSSGLPPSGLPPSGLPPSGLPPSAPSSAPTGNPPPSP